MVSDDTNHQEIHHNAGSERLDEYLRASLPLHTNQELRARASRTKSIIEPKTRYAIERPGIETSHQRPISTSRMNDTHTYADTRTHVASKFPIIPSAFINVTKKTILYTIYLSACHHGLVRYMHYAAAFIGDSLCHIGVLRGIYHIVIILFVI